MENKDTPAFAHCMVDPRSGAFVIGPGLTKREYFAAMAMQGLLSIHDDTNGIVPNESNLIYMAGLSVKAADTLLKELEK